MHTYHVLGLMSGSSLDGLDIAYCRFVNNTGGWQFELLQTAVVEFTPEWIDRLKALPQSNARTLWQTHAALGNYFGECAAAFIAKHHLSGKVDVIASHGHTIFHFPPEGFTTQIGDGAAIAARTGVPVVCDLRTADIAQGGQGTPIVPIGDKLLFTGHRFCLNIGGIANISCKKDTGDIVAFDICAANQVLNNLAGMLGKEYDAGGAIARSGKLNTGLLDELSKAAFYSQPYPKSLDNSFSRTVVWPVLEQATIPVEDKLRTYTELIAHQVGAHIKAITVREGITLSAADKILVTGGGAFNTYLTERIQALSGVTVDVPTDELVKFKEALVIALMGVLRMRGEVNVLRSVTGAKKDTTGGAMYLP